MSAESSATASRSSQNGKLNIEDVDNLPAVIGRLIDRIDELEERVRDLEHTDRADRLDRVIEHADRSRRGDGDVTLGYSEVMAAAGVSAPTAYSYMDELSENHSRVEKVSGESGVTRLVISSPH